MEYSADLKWKGILSHASTWMNLEDILSDVSQSQKDKLLYDFSYIRLSKLVNFVDIGSRMVYKGQGEGEVS